MIETAPGAPELTAGALGTTQRLSTAAVRCRRGA